MTNPETSSDLVKRLEWINTIPERSEVKSIVGLYFAYAEGAWTSPITGHHFDVGTIETAKAAAQADYATRILSAIDATTIERLTAEWTFCPECGSEEVRYEEGRHKQCAACGQEWFSDLNYVDVVQKNLCRLTAERDEYAQAVKDQAAIARWNIARAEAAESLAARQAEALNWAMDEIDVLSNKLNDFAYPQGMAMVGRRDQLDNYRKAVDARRALATESSNG